MSRLNHYIRLEAPRGLGKPGERELIVSPGHRCGHCLGNGWFWGSDESGERVKRACPMCGGSGELTALVRIEWQRSRASVDWGDRP